MRTRDVRQNPQCSVDGSRVFEYFCYVRFNVVSRDEIQLRDGRTRYEIEVHEVME